MIEDTKYDIFGESGFGKSGRHPSLQCIWAHMNCSFNVFTSRVTACVCHAELKGYLLTFIETGKTANPVPFSAKSGMGRGRRLSKISNMAQWKLNSARMTALYNLPLANLLIIDLCHFPPSRVLTQSQPSAPLFALFKILLELTNN